MVSKLTKLTKNKIFIGGGILVVILIGAYLFGRGGTPKQDTVTVKRGTVVQEVGVTGTVKSTQTADLAFERTGRVARINVVVGDAVITGQRLIELDRADAANDLAAANANVAIQEAQLSQLKRGTRPEELAIQEARVGNAQISMADSKQNLIDKINDAYLKADDAVHNKIDPLFTNPRSNDPVVKISEVDFQVKSDLQGKRVSLESLFTRWRSDISNLNEESDLASAVSTAKTNLDIIKSFADRSAYAFTGLTTSVNLSQAAFDALRSDVSTARTTKIPPPIKILFLVSLVNFETISPDG